jgi:hypothetical protein
MSDSNRLKADIVHAPLSPLTRYDRNEEQRRKILTVCLFCNIDKLKHAN